VAPGAGPHTAEVAAIEGPGEDGEVRAGERVARTDPVTAVFSRQVRPGREAESEERSHWLGRVERLTEDEDVVMPLVTRFLRPWLGRRR
jgi:antibiotic biosynthesis monooxygenase (ABM) superfamily enzyme